MLCRAVAVTVIPPSPVFTITIEKGIEEMKCDQCELTIRPKLADEHFVWGMQDLCFVCYDECKRADPVPSPSGVRPLWTGLFDIDE